MNSSGRSPTLILPISSRWIGRPSAVCTKQPCNGLGTKRSVTIRGRELPVPTLRVALAQSPVSAANRLAMATLMWVPLGARVPLPTVAAVLRVAAVAGVVTHMPAGLGVLETVFVVLVGDRISGPALPASLLAYRAIYHLVPLGVAALAWPLLESGAPAATARGAP